MAEHLAGLGYLIRHAVLVEYAWVCSPALIRQSTPGPAPQIRGQDRSIWYVLPGQPCPAPNERVPAVTPTVVAPSVVVQSWICLHQVHVGVYWLQHS